MNTCGLGHDVVDVAAFAEQLAEPGSRMRALFSVREVRTAAADNPDDVEAQLAVADIDMISFRE